MKNAPKHPTASAGRLNSIDTLRGIAALSVLIFHARGLFWIGGLNMRALYGNAINPVTLMGYASFPISYGFLGVQLFFVLSGYCIHRRGAMMIAENPQARLPLKNFFFRRLWRIYPTYLAALLLTAGLDYLAHHTLVDPIGSPPFHSLPTLIANIFMLQGIFTPFYGSNGVLWTLSIEMHLYLVYPLLFFISRKRGPYAALAFTFLVSLVYIVVSEMTGFERHAFPYAVGYNGGPLFIPYWFTWCVGFFVAEMQAGRANVPRLLYFAAIPCLLAGMILYPLHHVRAAEPFFALAMGSLLVWALSRRSQFVFNTRLASAFAAIGVFSYSLYAVHVPCLHLLHVKVFPTTSKYLGTTLVTVLISVAAAYLMFQLVERWSLTPPGQWWTRRISKLTLTRDRTT